MSVQSPWHMSACTSVCGFHNRQEGVIGSEVSRGGRRFVSVCATSFLCVVLSWLRTRGSSLLLCTTMEGFQSDAFYGNLFSSSCMQMKPECFFFSTLYTVLNFVCQSYWIEFALLPDLMSLFFVFDEWLGSWTITLRSLSLFVLYFHRAKSLQYIRAVPWKKVFMLPFRLTRVLFGFRCIPDALLWNDSAFLARSSLRREYILSDA